MLSVVIKKGSPEAFGVDPGGNCGFLAQGGLQLIGFRFLLKIWVGGKIAKK